MKKLLIEDVNVGVSKGGIACGPVGGHVVVEVQVCSLDNNVATYHSLAEVDGTLNFTVANESLFDIQIEENYEDEESWDKITNGEVAGYCDYAEFYEDIEAHVNLEEEQICIRKYLAYLARASWDEVRIMKAASVGKCFGDFDIPVCDAEQDYLDEHNEDGNV